MPSTYSPDLRIELIANGEKTGTWGTITNSNLGTLLEDAISGLVTVSITSAAQALTIQDGAYDQARNAAVAVTTTTTANFSVFVPPVTKLYVFRNSSAYVATVYASTVAGNTTAAGTGVAVPAGKSVLLRCDGVNIVEQFNHVVGNFSTTGNLSVGGTITASTLDLTTPLPAIEGGTGQSSYTTGDLVYASSSTAISKLADVATGNALISGGVGVAPAYGKIGLTTHVSGVLPIANGGTNATDAAGARTNIGLGTIATQDANAVNITGGSITGITDLAPADGGTGQSSYAIGDLLYASGTTALSKLADVATGNALISGGIGVAPSYGKIGLTTHVSGILPEANGGTGLSALGTGVATWLGTPTSANLRTAVTDETGTGSLVFATSPTLVTPALGTPTAIVLSSATGLPLTTGVTGTLPVANGGTGVTTSTGTGSTVLSASPTFTGAPLAPTAAPGTNTTQLATTAFLQAALSVLLPTGVITMWSGSIVSIPTGWLICDGTSGTPDLRDRFIVGAGSTYAVAATGGATSVTSGNSGTLTTNTSTVVVNRDGWTTTGGSLGTVTSGRLVVGSGVTEGAETLESLRAAGANLTTGSHSHTIDGHTHTVDTIPPYYALAYIMKS